MHEGALTRAACRSNAKASATTAEAEALPIVALGPVGGVDLAAAAVVDHRLAQLGEVGVVADLVEVECPRRRAVVADEPRPRLVLGRGRRGADLVGRREDDAAGDGPAGRGAEVDHVVTRDVTARIVASPTFASGGVADVRGVIVRRGIVAGPREGGGRRRRGFALLRLGLDLRLRLRRGNRL